MKHLGFHCVPRSRPDAEKPKHSRARERILLAAFAAAPLAAGVGILSMDFLAWQHASRQASMYVSYALQSVTVRQSSVFPINDGMLAKNGCLVRIHVTGISDSGVELMLASIGMEGRICQFAELSIPYGKGLKMGKAQFCVSISAEKVDGASAATLTIQYPLGILSQNELDELQGRLRI